MSAAAISQARATPPSGSKRAQLSLLLGNRKHAVVWLAVMSIVVGLFEVATLAVIAELAATLVKGSKHLHVSILHVSFYAPIPTMIEVAAGLTVLRLVLQVPMSLVPARIATDVQAGLRERMFQAYAHASWGVQSQDREGQMQETITNQVVQATAGAMMATSLMTSSFSFITMMAAAVVLSPLCALMVGGTTLVAFGGLRPLRGMGQRSARALSKAQVQFARAVAESIRVAQEVHVFGVTVVQCKRVGHYIDEARRRFYRTRVISGLVGSVYQSIIYMLLVAGLGGLYLVGRNHTGQLTAVLLVMLRGATSGQAVQASYQGLVQSLPFIERTTKAIGRYADSRVTDDGEPLEHVSSIVFEDVSFSYNPGRPVLSGISFEVDAGEVIGIVGPTGAGKSTLVQLVLRLRAPEHGSYLINGRPARSFSGDDWHRQVSYLPQEPRLLHASVAENIRFFREIPDEEVERAARLARIHDDIMSWPKGYDTIVGPRADAVSGGQQQRLCLARALAARPAVLVLDEPTSALDPNSEAQIQESLMGLKSDLTLFIIAHRMSTLDACDRVMVIVDGQLVAFDTKALLQQNNSYYRHASQLALGSSARVS